MGEPQTQTQTMSIEVLSFDGKNYTLKQIGTTTINGQTVTIPLTISVGKIDYYKNFINGAPDVFANYA